MDSSASGGAVEVPATALVPRKPVVLGLVGIGAAAALGFALASLDLFGVPVGRLTIGFPGLYVAILCGWALYGHVIRGNLARREPVRLRVDEHGLTAVGAKVPFQIARAELREGHWLPRAGGGVLQLIRTGHLPFHAEVARPEANRVLAALGLDAGSHRASFWVAAPAVATMPRQIALAFAAGLGMAALHLVGPLLLPVFLLLGIWPARLTAGVDGFLLRWLWWKRFVPMAEVVSVTAQEGRAIELTLRSKRVLTWYTSMRQKTETTAQRDFRDGVLERMRESLQAARGRPHADQLASTLGRNDRTHAEWIEALGQLRRGEADYRTAALSRDDLWHVLEDPAAPEDARAGAAFVLGTGDDRDDARLRVAANATVSPRLRVALDSASTGHEDELAEALQDIEIDPSAARARVE